MWRSLYRDVSDEDSIISTPLASTVDIIKAVAKKWKNMEMNVKNEWKLLARKINVLPILGEQYTTQKKENITYRFYVDKEIWEGNSSNWCKGIQIILFVVFA